MVRQTLDARSHFRQDLFDRRVAIKGHVGHGPHRHITNLVFRPIGHWKTLDDLLVSGIGSSRPAARVVDQAFDRRAVNNLNRQRGARHALPLEHGCRVDGQHVLQQEPFPAREGVLAIGPQKKRIKFVDPLVFLARRTLDLEGMRHTHELVLAGLDYSAQQAPTTGHGAQHTKHVGPFGPNVEIDAGLVIESPGIIDVGRAKRRDGLQWREPITRSIQGRNGFGHKLPGEFVVKRALVGLAEIAVGATIARLHTVGHTGRRGRIIGSGKRVRFRTGYHVWGLGDAFGHQCPPAKRCLTWSANCTRSATGRVRTTVKMSSITTFSISIFTVSGIWTRLPEYAAW